MYAIEASEFNTTKYGDHNLAFVPMPFSWPEAVDPTKVVVAAVDVTIRLILLPEYSATKRNVPSKDIDNPIGTFTEAAVPIPFTLASIPFPTSVVTCVVDKTIRRIS